MRKRERVLQVASVLSELMVGEVKLRWQRSRNGSTTPRTSSGPRPRACASPSERLGPLYIKVGQVLSTRPDLVSQTVIDALQDLHEQVDGPAVLRVRARPGQEPRAPTGATGSRRSTPTCRSGRRRSPRSTGRCRHDGQEVVLKIQRPGVAASTRLDMEILAQAVKLAMKRMPDDRRDLPARGDARGRLLGHAARRSTSPLEAGNMDEFREMLEDFEHLRVPDVLDVTKEVLVMTQGSRACRSGSATSTTSPPRSGRPIGRDLCVMLFHGFMVDGMFHADPHPGNVFVAPGEPATVIDFGMVGRIDRRMALGYTRFMMAIALNDGEAAGRAALEMGTLTSRANVPGFLSDMQRYIPTMANQSLQNMEFGNNFNQFLVLLHQAGHRRQPRPSPCSARPPPTSRGRCAASPPSSTPFDVFRDTMGDILRDQAKQLVAEEELLRIANEAFSATRSHPRADALPGPGHRQRAVRAAHPGRLGLHPRGPGGRPGPEDAPHDDRRRRRRPLARPSPRRAPA